MRRLSPAWFLFLFAPLTPEYVSGSTANLNPIFIVANLLLYGVGTLLIREFRVRRNKGWLAVFLLAPAYMVAEEGVMLNTLFDPTQNTVGRAAGVNWVWTTGMLVVHCLLSVVLPILLAEAVYAEQAEKSWVRTRTCWYLLAAFATNILVLGRLMVPLHRPPLLYWLIQFAFIGMCVWAASRAPGRSPAFTNDSAGHESSRLRLFLGSLMGMAITMMVGFAAPGLPLPAPIKIVLMLGAFTGFVAWLRQRGVFRQDKDRLARFAAASGMIAFFILISPLTSIGKENVLPACFGALAAVLLARELRRAQAAEALTEH